MNREIKTKKWVLVEANRALRAIMLDKGSYYHKVFSDDAVNIRAAQAELEKLLNERPVEQTILRRADISVMRQLEERVSSMDEFQKVSPIGLVLVAALAELKALTRQTNES